MSRIDEAWKHVSLGRSAAGAVDRSDPLADELTIEQYVPESAVGIDTKEAVPTGPATSSAPSYSAQPLSLRPDVESSERLVVGIERNGVSLEQYRRLAATLHESQEERGLKTVMVTSAMPGEGKTLTITNLALTFSESYRRRVLLIDGDFRRPSVHKLLGIPRDPGLSDLLRGDLASPPYVQVSQHLTVLPAGRSDPNPQALLSSDRLRMLVEEAMARFDWVLMDASPIGSVSDAQILGRLAQGVLLVIRAGSTPADFVRRAIDTVGRERIVGTVLNAVDEQVVRTGSYRYYDSE